MVQPLLLQVIHNSHTPPQHRIYSCFVSYQHLGAQLTSRLPITSAAATHVLANILRHIPSSAAAVCDTPDIAAILLHRLKIDAAASDTTVALATATLKLLSALALTADGYSASAGQPLVAPAVCTLFAKHCSVKTVADNRDDSELHCAAASCLAALTVRGKTSRKALASDAGACIVMMDSFLVYGCSISSNVAISNKVIPSDWNEEAKAAAQSAAATAAAAAAAACTITGRLLCTLCNLSQLDESRSCLGCVHLHPQN
jgi:hypothetical protein